MRTTGDRRFRRGRRVGEGVCWGALSMECRVFQKSEVLERGGPEQQNQRGFAAVFYDLRSGGSATRTGGAKGSSGKGDRRNDRAAEGSARRISSAISLVAFKVWSCF